MKERSNVWKNKICVKCLKTFTQNPKRRYKVCPKCKYQEVKSRRASTPDYWKNWYARNRRRLRDKAKVFYHRNREKELARRNRYVARHRGKVLAYSRDWYLRNRLRQMRNSARYKARTKVKKRKRTTRILRAVDKSRTIFAILNTVSLLKTHASGK